MQSLVEKSTSQEGDAGTMCIHSSYAGGLKEHICAKFANEMSDNDWIYAYHLNKH